MLNHIVIMGRLTRVPELRHTGSGLAVASFSLAVDRDIKSSSGDRETDFIDCVGWRKTAEFIAKNFTKGSMAVVSGRLQIRQWQDKDGGNRRTAEVLVDNIYFGESKRDASQSIAPQFEPPQHQAPQDTFPAAVPQSPGDFALMEGDDSELPF